MTSQPQNSFLFSQFDSELDLASALYAKTGRDLFAGVTEPADRQAAARIAIVMNKLEGEFGPLYARVYGEPLPERQRMETPARRKSA